MAWLLKDEKEDPISISCKCFPRCDIRLAPNAPLTFKGLVSLYDARLPLADVVEIDSKYLLTSDAHDLYPLLKYCLIDSEVFEFDLF